MSNPFNSSSRKPLIGDDGELLVQQAVGSSKRKHPTHPYRLLWFLWLLLIVSLYVAARFVTNDDLRTNIIVGAGNSMQWLLAALIAFPTLPRRRKKKGQAPLPRTVSEDIKPDLFFVDHKHRSILGLDELENTPQSENRQVSFGDAVGCIFGWLFTLLLWVGYYTKSGCILKE